MGVKSGCIQGCLLQVPDKAPSIYSCICRREQQHPTCNRVTHLATEYELQVSMFAEVFGDTTPPNRRSNNNHVYRVICTSYVSSVIMGWSISRYYLIRVKDNRLAPDKISRPVA